MSHDDMGYAEALAWSRHPDTVARMDQILAENRQREFEQAELEMKRIEAERAEQERQRRLVLSQARAREAREERAKKYGLKVRPVHFARRGDHCFWRTDHKTKRMIHGTASTPAINTHRYSLDSSKCQIELPIPLLVSHEHFGSVGELVMVRRSPREVYVIAALHDDNPAADYTWQLIQDGVLKGFSCAAEGPSQPLGSVLDVKFFGTWKLSEVSLCKQGANPDCNDVEIFSHRRKLL